MRARLLSFVLVGSVLAALLGGWGFRLLTWTDGH